MHRSTASRHTADGSWRRLARGVHLPHPRPPSNAELLTALKEYAGADVVLTGPLACALLGMRWIPVEDHVHGLVDGQRRLRSSPYLRLRRCAGLDRLETWSCGDVRVAPPERAVLDAGLCLPSLGDVRGVVLGAVADRWTSPDELDELLAREPRNGTALLRRAIRDAHLGCASPPEAELVDALVGRGVPFLVNPEVWVGREYVGSPDAWFLGTGCGSEMDSRERHEGDDDFDATLARHDRFARHGLVLTHLTPRRFRRDPHGCVAAVLAAAAVPRREPVGLRLVPRGPVLG